mmetsp:Transcript_32225/g.102735  ORF Transcript_32225/g.102735 Transcript_32225/m.102735 type:complete len:248 (-) Transcript_32225:595-1338(-)
MEWCSTPCARYRRCSRPLWPRASVMPTPREACPRKPHGRRQPTTPSPSRVCTPPLRRRTSSSPWRPPSCRRRPLLMRAVWSRAATPAIPEPMPAMGSVEGAPPLAFPRALGSAESPPRTPRRRITTPRAAAAAAAGGGSSSSHPASRRSHRSLRRRAADLGRPSRPPASRWRRARNQAPLWAGSPPLATAATMRMSRGQPRLSALCGRRRAACRRRAAWRRLPAKPRPPRRSRRSLPPRRAWLLAPP